MAVFSTPTMIPGHSQNEVFPARGLEPRRRRVYVLPAGAAAYGAGKVSAGEQDGASLERALASGWAGQWLGWQSRPGESGISSRRQRRYCCDSRNVAWDVRIHPAGGSAIMEANLPSGGPAAHRAGHRGNGPHRTSVDAEANGRKTRPYQALSSLAGHFAAQRLRVSSGGSRSAAPDPGGAGITGLAVS
jgi:hypothetical protein